MNVYLLALENDIKRNKIALEKLKILAERISIENTRFDFEPLKMGRTSGPVTYAQTILHLFSDEEIEMIKFYNILIKNKFIVERVDIRGKSIDFHIQVGVTLND